MHDESRFAHFLERNSLIDTIAILAIGLVVIVGFKLSPLLSPQADVRLTPDAGCNLHRGRCTVRVEQGQLEVSISPRPVPLLKPIQLEVRSTGIDVRRIDADFSGVDMNMGYNRPQLLPVGATDAGLYRAETSLPVCITSTMNWEMTLMLETGSQHILIPIRFTTPELGEES